MVFQFVVKALKLFPCMVIMFLKVEVYAGAIYDAIYLYAIALNETLAAGGDKKDGRAIVHRMLNKEFEGPCSCNTKIMFVQQLRLYLGSVI